MFVNAGVHLGSGYGGTEFGCPVDITIPERDEKDWEYFRFSDRVKVRWVPQGDGTFECQFLVSETHQPSVLNLPDVEGYATSDLFAKHPKYDDLWKIVGRIDDVIVHASGEKTIPAPMEDVIMSSPLVQSVVVFGRERDQAGVLIEPSPGNAIDVKDETQVAVLRNKLWPIIEEANKVAPAFSRLFKETILISSTEKPLPRTGKGTVMRKAVLAVYEKEISDLYETVDSSLKAAQNTPPPASWALDDVRTWIMEQAADLLSSSNVLSATFLRLRIVGALRASQTKSVQSAAQGITQNLIYSYPVIQELATHVVSLVTSDGDAQSVVSSQGSIRIEEMIDKYSVGLDNSTPNTAFSRTGPAVVLLTGSTGNLGSEILAALLKDMRVDRVYAFNRQSQGTLSVEQRQFKAFKERGLKTELLDSEKLTYISGDSTQRNLGLDPSQYTQLSRSINIIIHNAWKLDFNLSLSVFEPHIQGTRHLVDLLKSGPDPEGSRFLFTSSISSVQSWPKSKGPCPEEVLADASFAVGGGYGEGKYVTERILAKSGLHATSFRIGQISGGKPKGAWAITDWVPILVKSSVTIGLLPGIEGLISWIPMDTVAAATVDAVLGEGELPQVVNIVHPQPVEGRQAISFIQSAIEEVRGQHLKIVPFSEWLAVVEGHAEKATEKTLADIPSIKLLEFFRSLAQGNDKGNTSNFEGREALGLPTFSIEQMLRVCGNATSGLRSIEREDVLMWVRYWHEVDYLT
ncbi:putative secondary metabolism biosynthetic enzyme [Blastosporella zonata]|nr:putative secondary metabolism biosynthetic enzyme [Blastosporella zonata]